MAAFSNEYHALVEFISTKAERDFKWNEFFEQAIFEASRKADVIENLKKVMFAFPPGLDKDNMKIFWYTCILFLSVFNIQGEN